jgi:hypothetical protein
MLIALVEMMFEWVVQNTYYGWYETMALVSVFIMKGFKTLVMAMEEHKSRIQILLSLQLIKKNLDLLLVKAPLQ